jgi:hypothetical protein
VLDGVKGVESSMVNEVPMARLLFDDARRRRAPDPASADSATDPNLALLAGHLHGLERHPRHRQRPPPVHPPGAQGLEGIGAFQIALAGTVIAILVQPTVGTISDYTITAGAAASRTSSSAPPRRALPLGIATSNGLFAIAAFVSLLQFSSNFAQGPFQGYVPDLVPAKQVGLASGLARALLAALGNVVGYVVAAIWPSG